MKKGIIAIASVIAISIVVVSCNFFAPSTTPKTAVDSPKTIIDTLKVDSGKVVIDSSKK